MYFIISVSFCNIMKYIGVINMMPTTRGLTGDFLLVFTLLIWLLFLIILLSNKNNRLNRWCFLSGMCFSLGVLKEYVYFTFLPEITNNFTMIMNESTALSLYSFMTAIQYFFSLPTAMMFAFYFSNLNVSHPKVFKCTRVCMFLFPLLIAYFYPYTQTRYFQLNDRPFYLMATLYNWIYGFLFTGLLMKTLSHEKQKESATYQQKRLICFSILIPIWFWLITVFLFHSLGWKHLFKVWQGDMLVVIIVLLTFLRKIFKEGLWGTRLYHQKYDWTKSNIVVQKNARFSSHMIKNELAKIEWCASTIADNNNVNEIDIIHRSCAHITDFLEKNNWYFSDIQLHMESFSIYELLTECLQDKKHVYGKRRFHLHEIDSEACIYADHMHLREVINNLLDNAIEATQETGQIEVYYKCNCKKHLHEITVEDNGCGIPFEQLSELFNPYVSTKSSTSHYGLGLYYCKNVIEKHKGKLMVESRVNEGSRFTIYLPQHRKEGSV